MASELRKTGISVVGELPWGAHFCYFYETKQDLVIVGYYDYRLATPSMSISIGVAEKTTPIVPKDAVQNIGNQQFVFVATEKSNEFVLRPVRLEPESNGFYAVLEGLNTGERVVTRGSFLLRAESLRQHLGM